jgi:peptidoglycan LD-endopeptidase LytH
MRRAGVAAVIVVASFVAASPAGAAGDVDAAQARANRAARELARATTAVAIAQDELASLQTRVADARAKVAGLRALLEGLALSQYLHGGAQPLALDARDLNRWARGRALLRLASLSTEDALERTRAARVELADVEAGVGRTVRDRRAALAGFRDQQRRAVAELQRLAAAQRQAASKAGRASGGKLAAATGGAPSVVATKGPWTCPVQGPHSFSNDYGAPRGGGATHQGNDILAPRGTPVVASVGGSAEQHPNRLGGLAYYLHGDDGRTYYGAHLDSFGASGRVAMGTVIGFVGNSGDAQGGPTHLHFEIHEAGGVVNPYPTLVRYC